VLNNFKNKNIYFVSDSDLDGVSTTVIAKYYIEPICNKIIYLNTGQRDMSDFNWNIFLKENIDTVIFADITPNSLEMYNKLKNELHINVYIFDHHETGKSILGDLPNYYYTDKSCASMLFYRKLIENILRPNRVIERYIFLTNLYDFWQDNHEEWEEAVKLQFLKKGSINWRRHFDSPEFEKNSDFIYAMIEKFKTSKRFMYTFRENNIIASEKRKEDKNFNSAKKSLKIRTDNSGNKYFYLEAPAGLSLIANKILKGNNSDVKYAVCRSTYKGAVENLSISLRSVPGFSVKEIAEKWGGGGHTGAAGLMMKSEEDYNDLISGKLHLI